MMKKKNMSSIYTLLCILLLTTTAYGQKLEDKVSVPFDSSTEKYTYVEIFEVPDKSSSELYQTVKNWFKEKYLRQDFLIDTENEEITDVGNFTVRTFLKFHKTKTPMTRTVIFNLNFLFKNGKSKLEISNIKLTNNADGTTAEEPLEDFGSQLDNTEYGKKMNKSMEAMIIDVFDKIDANMVKLIDEIETTLVEGNKKDSDW